MHYLANIIYQISRKVSKIKHFKFNQQALNSVLYNIVDAYNKEEVQKAKKEHRKAELLPKVSAHVMRHTACTRMAECRMDIKVLQYIMGHAHIDVTMDVYNHLGDRERIEQEIARLDSMAVNF